MWLTLVWYMCGTEKLKVLDNYLESSMSKCSFLSCSSYIDLAKPKSWALIAINYSGLSLQSNWKPVLGQQSTSKKHLTLMSLNLSLQCSGNTGQQIPWVDPNVDVQHQRCMFKTKAEHLSQPFIGVWPSCCTSFFSHQSAHPHDLCH